MGKFFSGSLIILKSDAAASNPKNENTAIRVDCRMLNVPFGQNGTRLANDALVEHKMIVAKIGNRVAQSKLCCPIVEKETPIILIIVKKASENKLSEAGEASGK